jgi:CRISPR-associated Csx2 family protein
VSRPRIFLSCLGTTDYTPAKYLAPAGSSLEESGKDPSSTPFVQVARLAALAKAAIHFDKICILATDEAKSKHWNALESEIKALNLSAKALPLSIPKGANEDEFWEIFQTITDALEPDSDVYFDFTHGLRSIPVLSLVALDYAVKAKGSAIKELSYGAWERGAETCPVWDLSQFLVLRDWTSGVDSLLNSGDSRRLAQVSKPLSAALKRSEQAAYPKSLEGLPRALQEFGDSIHLCHSPSLTKRACNLRALALQAVSEARRFQSLKPLALVLEQVADSVKQFPTLPDEPHHFLRSQYAAAYYCLNHKLYMQAFTFTNEAFVTLLGILTGRETKEEREKGPDELLGSLRHFAKAILNKEPLTFTDSSTSVENQNWIKQWMDVSPALPNDVWTALLKCLSPLKGQRNKLDHAYTGEKSYRKEPDDGEALKKLGETCLDLLSQCLNHLARQPITRDELSIAQRQMLVLMSHQPTTQQLDDAAKNWHVSDFVSAPSEILNRWSSVDPSSESIDAELEEVSAWLTQVGRPGDLVLVQGEPGLAFATVRKVDELGMVPVYSTTKRQMHEEVLADGQVRKTSTFEHVRFRQYPL